MPFLTTTKKNKIKTEAEKLSKELLHGSSFKTFSIGEPDTKDKAEVAAKIASNLGDVEVKVKIDKRILEKADSEATTMHFVRQNLVGRLQEAVIAKALQ